MAFAEAVPASRSGGPSTPQKPGTRPRLPHAAGSPIAGAPPEGAGLPAASSLGPAPASVASTAGYPEGRFGVGVGDNSGEEPEEEEAEACAGLSLMPQVTYAFHAAFCEDAGLRPSCIRP
eukprot:15484949-Alexandrium_andersonii.AAC.1